MSNIKSYFEIYEEEKKAKQAEEQQKLEKEKMTESFKFSAKLRYSDKLNSICMELESDIRKNCKLFELEQFNDYKNVSHDIIIEIINEIYPSDMLERHRYKQMGL